MTRTAVFDPDALDDDLDDLLPPPAANQQPQRVPPTKPQEESAPADPPQPGVATSGSTPASTGRRAEGERRRPRGSGGRPPAETTQASAVAPHALIVVAARIPTGLWQQVSDKLLSGRERPSYAQVLTWTCLDHPKEVIDRIQVAAANQDRTPRGRRVAAPVNTITVRFRADELATFDALLAEAGGEGPAPTRTSGVIAAFEVAVKHAD